MKAQGAAIQGGLAILALIAAYATWQREPTTKEDVVVLDVSKNEIELIRYDDQRHWVEIQKSNSSGGPVVWVREGMKDPPPPAVDAGMSDGGLADGGRADAGPQPAKADPPDAGVKTAPKVREYRGNPEADKVYDHFTPLRAVRSLGVLDPKKLKEVGLENPERRLEIKTGSTQYVFTVGTAALGAGTPYLRQEKDGRVYLLRGTVLSDLEFASSKLVERRLHAFKPEDWDTIKVTAANQSRELTQVGGQKLADKGQKSPDDFVKNWHDKVMRAVVIEPLGRGEKPNAGDPNVELKIDYLHGTKNIGFLELGRAGNEIFARTELTAGWSRISGGDDLLTEAKKVVGNK